MQIKWLICWVSDSIIISHILIPFSVSHMQFVKFSQYSWHLKPIILKATGRKRWQDGWSGKWILLTVVLNLPCWKALSCMEAKLCLIPSKQSRQEKGKYINSKKRCSLRPSHAKYQELLTRNQHKKTILIRADLYRKGKRKECWAEIEIEMINIETSCKGVL